MIRDISRVWRSISSVLHLLNLLLNLNVFLLFLIVLNPPAPPRATLLVLVTLTFVLLGSVITQLLLLVEEQNWKRLPQINLQRTFVKTVPNVNYYSLESSP